jgi:hypothetical protein
LSPFESKETPPQIPDPLENDKPGEELSPGATIWKMYAARAEKEDGWVSKYLNEDLDVMLIFVCDFIPIDFILIHFDNGLFTF